MSVASVLLCLVATERSPGAVVQVAGREYEIPDGFTLQQVAGPDLVPRPIVGDFDARGNLIVADSSGSNDDVKTQLSERPHRILRLTDTNGDGIYDERTVFADHMMFPEGVLCHQGSVYVSAPPQIWKLTDADGDGRAERREVWFDGQTLTGCANDLHGPYLGPDGWIYWCKGAFAEQSYTLAGGDEWSTRAAHIFRRRVSGGPIESVMTGGMDNPVDVTFTAAGERIFTTTFLQHPAGGRRDGLIHAIYGGVYGKEHGVLDGHPRTGELMPVLTHLGPAAPSGLTRIKGDSLGAPYNGNLVSCAFNLHQVIRHVLSPDGATFQSTDSPLLSSPDLDFHPTDVIQDADGSIVVIDTGGWYKLCCPTSQLHKPDVLGGIYRLRREGTPVVEDPRGLELSWKQATIPQLVGRLDDSRHVVRQRAVEQLAERGVASLPALAEVASSSSSVRQRRQAVWAACRVADPAAVQNLRLALEDRDPSVRQSALHAISVRRDESAADAVIACLADDQPAVRRVAAEAVGRLRAGAAISLLLQQMQQAEGRVLEHSLVYALIQIGDSDKLKEAWPDADAAARRAILLALDQMPGGGVDVNDVLTSLSSPDDRLRQAATWILSHHAEWATSLAAYVLDHLQQLTGQPTATADIVELLSTFAGNADVQSSIAAGLGDGNADPNRREILLQVLRGYEGGSLTDDLQLALARILESGQTQLVGEAVRVLSESSRDLSNTTLIKRIQELAQRTETPRRQRLQAISALRSVHAPLPDELFRLALRTVIEDEEFDMRRLATDAISGCELTPDQLGDVIESLPDVAPVELGQLVFALKQTKDDAVANRAITQLQASDALVVIPDSLLREAFDHFGAPARGRVDELLNNRIVGHADQLSRLGQLMERLPGGDIRRGQQVFHSSKAACFTCHAMGYRGGDIGPDLTRIGKIRNRRDLLEAIVFPSASFVRSYEPLSVTTWSGLTVQGVVKDENDERLLLINDQRKPIEVARADIEIAEPGRLSVMPSGLDQLLSESELADLLAFLEAAR